MVVRSRQSRRRALVAAVLGIVTAACGAGGSAASRAVAEGPADTRTGAAEPVWPGVDLLFRDSLHLVRGLRVGLITNPTGVDAQGRSTIDRLHDHPEVQLATLFAPEHGLRAAVGEGQHIDDGVDPRTGLPVVSLYTGAKRAPTPEDLQGLDVLLFDIQDVGARYYTYIYTLALSMQAAGAAGVPVVVLDRPNPIGRAVQGNVLDPAHASFVGLYPLPMRHGLTVGELARLYRREFGVEVALSVVPVEGWTTPEDFARTRLPWVAPSPNMPDLATARHYPGLCLFEGTSLSVGRGTDHPFQQVGGPGLDGVGLAARMNALGLPGVRFEAVRFTPRAPTDGKWAETELEGVRLVETEPERYDPTRTAVALLLEARRAAGEAWQWNAVHFDRLAGTDALRLGIDAGHDLASLTRSWGAEQAAFATRAAPYRLYPP